jgi:hypothetical protein
LGYLNLLIFFCVSCEAAWTSEDMDRRVMESI